jgi:hypothetical protein
MVWRSEDKHRYLRGKGEAGSLNNSDLYSRNFLCITVFNPTRWRTNLQIGVNRSGGDR